MDGGALLGSGSFWFGLLGTKLLDFNRSDRRVESGNNQNPTVN